MNNWKTIAANTFLGLMTLVMIIFAAVQFNDPDGWMWVLLYGYAAALGAGLMANFRVKIPALLGLIGYGLYALFLIPADLSNWIHVEEAREGFGTLICAVWCLILAAVSFWRGRKAET